MNTLFLSNCKVELVAIYIILVLCSHSVTASFYIQNSRIWCFPVEHIFWLFYSIYGRRYTPSCNAILQTTFFFLSLQFYCQVYKTESLPKLLLLIQTLTLWPTTFQLTAWNYSFITVDIWQVLEVASVHLHRSQTHTFSLLVRQRLPIYFALNFILGAANCVSNLRKTVQSRQLFHV